jgi:hypothetical protein
MTVAGHGRVGSKKRGAQSLVGTIRGDLMRVPIGNFFAQIYDSARDPNIATGVTIRDSCYKLRYKRDRGRQSRMVIYQWFNELEFESRRPHHTKQGPSAPANLPVQFSGMII